MTQELTLIERAQQALRGEEPWEPIMGRIHAFVRGDLDAEIAALKERLRAVEAERDEWKRKYETQCAGSMSAHERRIHLEADLSALRAELERKDAALKDLAELSRYDPGYPYSYTAETACKIMNEMRYAARAALKPKEPPCKS